MRRFDKDDEINDEDDDADEDNSIDSDDDSTNLLLDEAVDDTPRKKGKSKREKLEYIQKFVFFDFETTQEKILRETPYGPEFVHVPNLCVIHVVCEECFDLDIEGCYRCGNRQRIFQGDNCLEDFCTFLFSKSMNYTTAIAHNAKGFDAQFILQFIYRQGVAIKPKIIHRGKTSVF
jgi:hypothetical protein